ncbi:MFS transporter [Nocardia sp. NPDC050378]|uniref:MFS transporter n=1 Tax=Nocardia sp. NPDC050378 TaxID=3155400 RepID=UPI00340E82BD
MSRKWLPLVAICLGAFILLVDVTIVNVALPQMAQDLNASMSALQWVIDAYALGLAAVLLAAGALADRVGRRRVYLIGLTVFAIASLVCGLAPNSAVLILGRATQGIGGAAMFATTSALLAVIYHGKDRAVAFSVWAAVSGSAAAVGPVLGGLLSQTWGWSSIFLINVPIAVLTIALSRSVLPESMAPTGRRFDFAGALSFTVAATALVAGLIEGAVAGWGGVTALLLGVGTGALVLFVLIEIRSVAPLLDLSLFRRPVFTGLMVAALLLPATAFASLGYTSIWLQSALGMSPLTSGLVVTPLSVASFLVATIAGRRLYRAHPRWTIGGGLVLIGAGALSQTAIEAGSGWPVLLVGLVLIGTGVGVATGPLMAAALETAPPQHAGLIGGAVNTFRQLGHALGVAVFGPLFLIGARETLAEAATFADPHAAASALGGGRAAELIAQAPPRAQESVHHVVHAAFTAGLDRIFYTAGIGAIAGAVIVFTLVRKRETATPVQPVEAPARAS